MPSYGIITKENKNNSFVWRFVSPGPDKREESLLKLLNDLGGAGWEVVGVGDFGAGVGDDIILKK